MLTDRKKQTFLHGAAILAVSTVIVKAIGALFKIPLNNLLDGVGMAYFSSAYTIFNTLYALSVAGLPVAVSRLVSQNVVLGRYRDIKKILKISRWLFICTGSLGFLVMLWAARPFSVLVKNPGAFLAIAVMSPAVMFCCMTAAYRGYYQGLSNMYPTAVSQVVEALAKLLFGTSLAWLTIRRLEEEYAVSGTILGMAVTDSAQAGVMVSQYAAAAAIGGIVVSTLFGTLYCWGRYLLGGDGISHRQIEDSPAPKSSRSIVREMAAVALPVCLGAVVLNVTSLIDMVSIMSCLEKAVERDGGLVWGMYAPYLHEDLRMQDLPAYLYGCYSGISVTMFNLIPALTSTIGVSALPAVTAAWVSRQGEKIRKNIESVLRVAAIVSFPAGIGLSVMAKPAAALVFSRSPLEAAVGGQLLELLGLAAVLVALSTPINSVLQAIGRITTPVKLMLLGAAVKLAVNYCLIQVPGINIQAAPAGTLACYGVIVALSLWKLADAAQIRLDWGSVFGKPLAAAVLCGVTARTSYGLLLDSLPGALATLGAIGLAAIVYAISLLLLGGICRQDVLMLPKGEKIAKLLEKYRLLG